MTNRAQQMGQELKETGRKVWLAGLGAVASMDETGRGVFAELVERGERWEQQRPAVPEPLRETAEKLKDFGHRVEHRVEERMATALHRFGAPGRDEIQALIERIEGLTRKVEDLSASN